VGRVAVLALVAGAGLAAAGWLFVENRALRADLAAARAARAHAEEAPAGPSAVPAPPPPASSAATPRLDAGERAAALLRLARQMAARPPAEPAPQTPDPDTRRDRTQKRVRELLGRAIGETEDQYRARVAPLVAMALARPRQRSEDKRQEFEGAAGLSPEQRAALDQAVADSRAELVTLASQAVTDGDLTPYRRNTLGLLNFVGDAAGIADGFDARVRGLLQADQVGLLDDTGFDLVEYLGLTTPWESVTPPPPAASNL
jgi:hypothetical protein